MNFSKTYRRMNEPVGPSPDLIRKTLSHPDRHRLPLRRLAAAAAVAAVLLATLVGQFTGWKIDGWCGILVACFILWSGRYRKPARTAASPWR